METFQKNASKKELKEEDKNEPLESPMQNGRYSRKLVTKTKKLQHPEKKPYSLNSINYDLKFIMEECMGWEDQIESQDLNTFSPVSTKPKSIIFDNLKPIQLLSQNNENIRNQSKYEGR